MDFISAREFRNNSNAVWKKLNTEGKIVITNNGKPQAIMIPVDASTLEDSLSDISRIEAKHAARNLRQRAALNGTSSLSADEIDGEIARVRIAKRKKGA